MKQFTSALLNSHSVDAAEFLDDISVSRRADNDRCYQIDGFSAGVNTQPQFSSLENIFSSTLVASPSWPMMPLPWMPGATWSPTPPAGRMQKKFPIHPEWHSHCCTVSDNVDGRNLPRLIQSAASSQSRRGSAQSRKSFLTSLIVHTIVLLLLALVHTATSNGGRLAALVITSHFVDCETEKEEALVTIEELPDVAPSAIDEPLPVDSVAGFLDDPSEEGTFGVELSEMFALGDVSTVSLDLHSTEQLLTIVPSGRRNLVDTNGQGLGDRGNGERGANFYNAKAQGDSFVYIIDYSGSMFGPRVVRLRYELQKSIRALPPEARFYIIYFHAESVAMPASSLVVASVVNKNRYLRWAEQSFGGGSTNPVNALAMALRLEPSAIFLMTDGVFDNPVQVFATVEQCLSGMSPGQVPIHTIAFEDPSSAPVLQAISHRSGGAYHFVSP